MRSQHMQVNFMTISLSFLTIASINLLVSVSSKAMFDQENEMEESKTAHIAPKGQKKPEETELEKENEVLSPMPMYQDNSPFGILPDSILIDIFGFLEIEDLGRVSRVSHHWYGVYSKPLLWEKVGLANYGDYFTRADLEENPKEKVIHHYLSVRLNVLDAIGEAGLSKNFKEKYDLSSLTPYFKAYLPRAVKGGYESFSSKKYGKFEVSQVIETQKEIEKLRRQRDDLIKQAISESKIETVSNPYHRYSGYYMGGKECISSIGRNPTMEHPVPNKIHLRSARKVNERLILLGDEDAARKKKEQLTTRYSEYAGLNNLYQSDEKDWDNFVKSSVDELCAKGYLFAFEWKVEWLVGRNEDRTEFIENMLQNENPAIRNMGHYLRVFGLKQGKLGYKKNQEEAVQYIRLYNIPY